MKAVKKVLKILLGFIIAILVFAVVFIGYLTVTEYKPEEKEKLNITERNKGAIALDQDITVVSFNIGYGALGETEDFFMDGGEKVAPENKEYVEENLDGIVNILSENEADIYLLQETDLSSARSFKINQSEMMGESLKMNSAFAYNYNCRFVPFPVPMIGHVESGLTTLSSAVPENAERISLPVPFSWPVRAANLKRCLLIERFDIEGTDKELVVINLHLEAYDDGEGKIMQTKVLQEIFSAEYEKGNYVIAGGDFNQAFPGTTEKYPMKNDDLWTPGLLSDEDFSGFGKFVFDDTVPTCRLLNAPYDAKTTQCYCIDGFIVSDNVKVKSVQTLNENFVYSDHNPVKLVFELS